MRRTTTNAVSGVAKRPSRLSTSKGEALAHEIEEWRKIGRRWTEHHTPYYRVAVRNEDEVRQGYALRAPLLMKRVPSTMGRRSVFLRATEALLKRPPQDPAEELRAWRQLAKPAVEHLDDSRIICNSYQQWIGKAKLLLGMPTAMSFAVHVRNTMITKEFEDVQQHPTNYEIVIRKKRGGRVIVEHEVGGISNL